VYRAGDAPSLDQGRESSAVPHQTRIELRQRFGDLQTLARFGFGWKTERVQEAFRRAVQVLDTGMRSFSLRFQRGLDQLAEVTIFLKKNRPPRTWDIGGKRALWGRSNAPSGQARRDCQFFLINHIAQAETGLFMLGELPTAGTEAGHKGDQDEAENQ